MRVLAPIALLAAAMLAACDNGGSNSQKGNEPATQSPETDQQGTQPSQPANPPQ
ncbi:hypothetical protein ACFWXH_07570 [Mesorhizobium sp. NPDC059054]|uniref:hypothetical protein n=1 Tax=Mesorhizobium sp. NPDC059054 TaxID=3346711 RepID=UPI0036D125A1